MSDDKSRGIFNKVFYFLVQLGLGETLLRVGTVTLSVVLLGGVIWLIQLSARQAAEAGGEVNVPVVVPTAGAEGGGSAPQPVMDTFGGVPRLAQERTIIPSRPRQGILKYTVLEGDSVFGIAEKFGLKPETIRTRGWRHGAAVCTSASRVAPLFPAEACLILGIIKLALLGTRSGVPRPSGIL